MINARRIFAAVFWVLFALGLLFLALTPPPASAGSIQFNGTGSGNNDRLVVDLDPHLPADIGATDFTVEFWLKADPTQLRTSTRSEGRTCNTNLNQWIYGNIVFDRSLYNSVGNGDWGISVFANGRLSVGMERNGGGGGICGQRVVADNTWHHVAVTRSVSTGQFRLWVDGVADGSASTPAGDNSYRNGQNPSPAREDWLGVGAEKFDIWVVQYPAIRGLVDEIRFSTTIRYTAPFTPPSEPFAVDPQTAALWHLDDAGDVANDAVGSSAMTKRPGATWVTDSPFTGPAPPPPPPPPPVEVWRLPAGLQPVFARDGNGMVASQIVVAYAPAHLTGTPVCDHTNTAVHPQNGETYMGVSGLALCSHGRESSGAQAAGYARCELQP